MNSMPVIENKLLYSIAAVFALWILRWLMLKIVFRQVEDSRSRYQWQKSSSYITFFIGLLLLGRIWFEGFHSIATYLGLLSAGLAIALKDPVANLFGWAFIVWRRPFDVGDRIQIGTHAGDIIDSRIFQFTIMEIGNWVHADQYTGRIIHIPNGRIFVEPQMNYTKGWFDYIWNEIPITITFESNWKKAKDILGHIVVRHAASLSEEARKKMKEASHKFMILSLNLQPIVYTTVENNGVLLTVRFLCDPFRRRETTQAIWEEVLHKFSESGEISFAYPTQRFYNDLLERRGRDISVKTEGGEK